MCITENPTTKEDLYFSQHLCVSLWSTENTLHNTRRLDHTFIDLARNLNFTETAKKHPRNNVNPIRLDPGKR